MLHKQINEDIYLKQLELEDSQSLFELVDKNRDYLREWLPWLDYNKEVKDSRDFIISCKEKYEGNKCFEMGIWYKNQLAGVVGIHEIDWQNEITSIGYWIAKDFQGLGLITQSLKFIIDHAFEELKLKKIQIKCAVENQKSRNIPEKLGFEYVGTNELAENLYGKLVDHAVYELSSPN